MIALIENPEEVNKLLKYESKRAEDVAIGVKEKFKKIYPDSVGNATGNSIWIVSRQTYCDDDWPQVIKSLRSADEDILHVALTNSYLEQRLNEYCSELKEMRNKSDRLAAQVEHLTKIDAQLSRLVSAFSRCEEARRRDARSANFRDTARRSKSAECCIHKLSSSCGVILRQCRTVPRREKWRRRKEFGKFCSTCGAIEVPSQISVIRCSDCHGEIIMQGQCSSCDSLELEKKLKNLEGEGAGKSCVSCKFVRERIWMSDSNQFKEIESRTENAFFCKHNRRKDYESSYCSDCEFASSWDMTAAKEKEKEKRNVSTDSLLPQSDSDNRTWQARPYSCDYDVSSSVSSFEADNRKLAPLASSCVEQGDTSLDEEYATPRENLSTEDVTAIEIDSDPSLETTLAGGEEVDDGGDSEEYVEALEPPYSDQVMVQNSVLDSVCDRVRHAEEALGDIIVGNLKLEERILTMENISQENLKLSMTLRDIVLEMTDRLNEVEKVKGVKASGDESEGSDDFEEALDDATDSESFYDIQAPSHCYLCLECGIGMFHQDLTNCPTCGRKVAEIPKGFFEKSVADECARKALVPAPSKCGNWKPHEVVLSALPVLFKGNSPSLQFDSIDDRLKLIKRETNLLRDNNEIISLFVDDLKRKLQKDLEYMQKMYKRKDDVGETTIVEFDLSFYQITRHIKERRVSEEAVVEELKEEFSGKEKTFIETKFEEVYKKEEQTALELEIFEERLEVEGLIIKEKEDFFACSNASEAVEDANSQPSEFPSGEALFLNPAAKFSGGEEELCIADGFTSAKAEGKKDDLFISIEIEVEKDRKSLRCEYKTNLRKRNFERERMIPTITLYPMWTCNRSALNYGNSETRKISNREYAAEEPDFTDVERDEFVQIKAPNFFSANSDDEDEEWNVEKPRVTGNAVASVTMPIAIYPVTEITLSETPFAVLNIVHAKKEFSRVSHIELSQSPESGIVFTQTAAMSCLSVVNCNRDDSFEEFFEAKSESSFHEKKKSTERSSIRFVPINLGGSSVVSIHIADEALPVVVSEEIRQVTDGESSPELMTALSLIREIENDVVEVKLANAIAILPQLESVLRDHIQNKTKAIDRSSIASSTSLDKFMSTLSFFAEDGEERETELSEIESHERLGKILNLLTGLEEAIRETNSTEDCEKQEQICNLILSTRIVGTGSDADVTAMEKTLELTSESNVALRDCNLWKDNVRGSEPETDECIITADTLKTLRKKIFDIVAVEAQERDSRIEEGIKRIRTLERENFEVMQFLDTLLDKTLTRVRELDELRAAAMVLRNEIQQLVPKPGEVPKAKIMRTPTLPSIQEVSSDYRTSSEEENVREALSDMIVALDNLKTKAKQKTERYREMFGDSSRPVTYASESEISSSSSSEIPHGKEGRKSRITQFDRIGATTFFMSWSKPMQADGDPAIVGYEIWVDGKLNQRVRNPERFKAVLYSVPPSTSGGQHRIKLFGVTEDRRRLSLADLGYPEPEAALSPP